MNHDLERISFAEWLIELNDCAASAGYKTGQSFVCVTGQMCWHYYYLEGLTPSTALEMAAQEGIEFGKSYSYSL